MIVDPRGRSIEGVEPDSRSWLAEVARPLRVRTLFATLTLVAIFCAIAVSVRDSRREHALLARLLQGDTSVRIQAMTIRRGDRLVVITNAPALAYLAECMRRSQPGETMHGGQPCTASLELTPKDVLGFEMYVTREKWALMTAESIEPGWPSHEVILLEPQPQQIRAMMEYLLATDPPSDTIFRIADE